jgi:misacylated tRNA(Ala) deacylase
MPTELLFRDNAYLRDCTATVLAATPEGVLLDRTIFYPQGGGQPGDAGTLRWAGGEMAIANSIKGAEPDTVLHLPAEGAALPAPGTPQAMFEPVAESHRVEQAGDRVVR